MEFTRLCSPAKLVVLLVCVVTVFLYSVFPNSSGTSSLSSSSPGDDISKTEEIQDAVESKKDIETFKYQGRSQDDPELVEYIKTLLRPPSVKPYRLVHPEYKHFTAMEQSKFVGNLYGPGKREGFFVEVGGLDGEGSSSTLYLERELGFSGLLIEANPVNYKKLISKERKCFTLNAALSPTTKAAELFFSGSHATGRLTDKETKSTIKVQAFPFYGILQAMNVSFIDVFNLDIEGIEFEVLKTIPWDKVKLGIMIFEHHFVPEPQEAVKFMKKLGYDKIHENSYDFIFADPAYLQKLKDEKQST